MIRASSWLSQTPRHGRPLAHRRVGEEGLAEAALVLGDEARGDREDVAAGAVVALEAHDHRARKIALEAQDVVDIRAAPAVDRLVVVADAAEIAAASREKPQPQILDDVGVLILVDEHVAEATLERREDVGVLPEEPEGFEQEIAEIDGVQGLQPRLIGFVERDRAAAREGCALARGNAFRVEAPVLPAVDERRQRPGGPALLVDVLGLQDLLEETKLVVRVEDREVRPQPHEFRVHAQDLGADRVECAEPRQALHRAGEKRDALAHFARGLVGEGDGQNLVRPRPSRRDDMGDARSQHPRLADSGPGQHENRPVEGLDRGKLFVVEAAQIGRAQPLGERAGLCVAVPLGSGANHGSRT